MSGYLVVLMMAMSPINLSEPTGRLWVKGVNDPERTCIMSMAKEWMKKVASVCVTAVNKYDTATKKAESYVMNKCGSERMMDDVVDEKTDTAITKVKDKTTDVVKRVKHTIKESTRVQTVVVRTNEYVSAAKKKLTHAKETVVEKTSSVVETVKNKTKKKSVPMCRPVSHISCDDVPITGVPQSDKTPAPMSTVGRMHARAAAGVVGVPMCVCK
jgi:hypothetical protein